MASLNRRGFLLTTSAGLGGALGLGAFPTSAAAHESLMRQTLDRVVAPEGTTLAEVGTAVGDGYRLLSSGPGWPIQVREDLVAAQSDRDDRRTPLASFVQFTDLHIMDAQSPVRFEYTHPLLGSGAHRPQETLGSIGASALVSRVNALRNGPVTGRPFDFMMTTGDNTDNHEQVELDWLMAILNGGSVTPNTGDSSGYEGVQNCGADLYWHPESDLADRYKTEGGFPLLPGFWAAALAEFQSPGLDIPWYCTVGNHDNTPSGTLPAGTLTESFVGDRKIMFAEGEVAEQAAEAQTEPEQVGELPREIERMDSAGQVEAASIIATVTPDERRMPFDPAGSSPRTWTRPTPAPDRSGTVSPTPTPTGWTASTPSPSPKGSPGSAWTPPPSPGSPTDRSARPSTTGWRAPCAPPVPSTTTYSAAAAPSRSPTSCSCCSATTPATP